MMEHRTTLKEWLIVWAISYAIVILFFLTWILLFPEKQSLPIWVPVFTSLGGTGITSFLVFLLFRHAERPPGPMDDPADSDPGHLF